MPSRYSLVIAVSKRAKQLRDGAPQLVECKSKNLITIALEEIAAGKVEIIIPSQAVIEAASRRQELVPERPKARQIVEILNAPESLDASTDDLDGLLDEDTDDEIVPLDEMVGTSTESDLESEE